MSIRYLTYLMISLMAGFIILSTQAFGTTATGWIAFAGGVLFALVAGGMTVRRGLAHRAINVGIAMLGVLIVIETRLASGAALKALSLAGGLGVLALAISGLTLHEISTERVVHSLEVSQTPSDMDRPVVN